MQHKIRTAVIDDEPLARDTLKHYLASYSDFELIGECSNGLEALHLINDKNPDLIFLDIQMPDLGGFEVLKRVEVTMPIVIFATAYDKYALQAFDANAIDYLLKPITKPRFNEAIQKVQKFFIGQRMENVKLIKNLLATYEVLKSREIEYISRILVKEKKKYFFIKSEEIYFFEASGDYVVVNKEKSKHWINESLNSLESRLDPKHFVRIHRSTILNINYIEDLEPYFNGEFFITLKNGKRLKLSRNYKERIKHLLAGQQF